MYKNTLLLIDCQNDFCDPKGSLYVHGAQADMKRLARLVDTANITHIYATNDSHSTNHIAHPNMWVDASGNHPEPFTIISVEDFENAVWRPSDRTSWLKFRYYLIDLKNSGKHQLCIWRPHCLVGSWGKAMQEDLFESLVNWEKRSFVSVKYIDKGQNPYTEHYSALKAEVADENDPSTLLNRALINCLDWLGVILIGGEASSHCVAYTVLDLLDNIKKKDDQKIVFLEDVSSPVHGFEKQAEDFKKVIAEKGVIISNTVDCVQYLSKKAFIL